MNNEKIAQESHSQIEQDIEKGLEVVASFSDKNQKYLGDVINSLTKATGRDDVADSIYSVAGQIFDEEKDFDEEKFMYQIKALFKVMGKDFNIPTKETINKKNQEFKKKKRKEKLKKKQQRKNRKKKK